jgi:hypothetical protein
MCLDPSLVWQFRQRSQQLIDGHRSMDKEHACLTQPLAPLGTSLSLGTSPSSIHFTGPRHAAAAPQPSPRRRRLSEPKTKVKLPPQEEEKKKSLTTTSASAPPLTMIRSLQFAVCVVPLYIHKAPVDVDTSMWFMQTRSRRLTHKGCA